MNNFRSRGAYDNLISNGRLLLYCKEERLVSLPSTKTVVWFLIFFVWTAATCVSHRHEKSCHLRGWTRGTVFNTRASCITLYCGIQASPRTIGLWLTLVLGPIPNQNQSTYKQYSRAFTEINRIRTPHWYPLQPCWILYFYVMTRKTIFVSYDTYYSGRI